MLKERVFQMRAIVFKKYGPPNVLRLEEVDKPTPSEDQLLIRVHAVEATKTDCEMRSFHFSVKWFWLPLRIAFGIWSPRRHILGAYFSGTIDAVGTQVTKFKVGDEIFGAAQLNMGAYGEFMCLPEHYSLALKPNNISFEEAAIVPLGGFNALHFLKKAKVQPGEKVLINGAGGSIGSFGVQIAKSMGAEVTAVDSGIKETALRNLGADYFLDYTKGELVKDDNKYDVIFDMVAESPFRRFIHSLTPNGRYLVANPRISDMLRSLYVSKFTDKKAIFAFAGEKIEELEELKALIEGGEITPVVDKIFPLEKASEAHQRVETEARLGPVAISHTLTSSD